jgi:hypothetical protein
VRGATRGIMRYIQRGSLVHQPQFGMLLAERIPRADDPIDVLLEEADGGADRHLFEADFPNLETLGLEER